MKQNKLGKTDARDLQIIEDVNQIILDQGADSFESIGEIIEDALDGFRMHKWRKNRIKHILYERDDWEEYFEQDI